MSRQLHLNLNFLNAGTYGSAWRWPGGAPGDFADPAFYIRTARLAERATFDAVFLADNPALSDRPEYRPFQSLEPTILLAAIAAATERIGLIATISSTYNEPYNLARRIATLDHTSHGRAGWNVVTTADRQTAANFGQRGVQPHQDRYARAGEFTQVVKALWDSWEDDALIGDADTARFVDIGRVHRIDHEGTYFSVRGPLNVPRPPQGRPILVQAGGSEDGRELAAEHADAVFSVAHALADAEEYATDLARRARRFGRRRDDILIFPGLVTVLGSTEAEARRREEALWDLVPIEYGLGRLAGTLQIDPARLRLDEPLPADIPLPPDHNHTFFRGALTLAERGRLTVRQLIRAQGGGTGHRILIGTPEQVAESIEAWFRSGAVDGFNIMPDVIPSGFEDFAEHVVPALRRRGIFRSDYAGTMLRDHFGLSRPLSPHSRIGAEAVPA
ncbi:NtaA/DmoA family FMN-dependent monooxygenase [Paracraurococcus lichenis]|uniref:NtaA/DmoA family FMN-dependent monooxygenase n=1 Tax=Paracraurococcus lichenis TaxID=3064888 RepID=A0ABT9E5R6_9PROT|nr:NtaA/DmoA family FMN-dependent monooxygenase [Paracraurococcus sp. LOR1-02]MDO9711447.1 NtaA/DmoA family FMN-dependent monooxygenase [Paracraurococcus sp. LOR1-02]